MIFPYGYFEIPWIFHDFGPSFKFHDFSRSGECFFHFPGFPWFSRPLGTLIYHWKNGTPLISEWYLTYIWLISNKRMIIKSYEMYKRLIIKWYWNYNQNWAHVYYRGCQLSIESLLLYQILKYLKKRQFCSDQLLKLGTSDLYLYLFSKTKQAVVLTCEGTEEGA